MQKLALEYGAHAAVLNEGFSKGGAGAAEMAEAVADACDQPNTFNFMYEDSDPIDVKIEKIAKRIYRAEGVDFLPAARQKIDQFTTRRADRPLDLHGQDAPVAVGRRGAGQRADRLSASPCATSGPYTGAGFLTALCGDIMQMPGLGKTPAGFNVDIDEDGKTVGLF